ncbi:MAG: hypothetical protein H6981_12820 [Gammaproteobacteria bacterium]|nr:hypothetical protein [Gammaproteobacteria bacterium]MCP5137670.1 hypothetical protein [Gammaproteobacteria bacterium]
MRAWLSLTPEEQTRMRIDYDRDNQHLPASCDIRTKNRRFQAWLAERDIDFPVDDSQRDDTLRRGESLAERFARWRDA